MLKKNSMPCISGITALKRKENLILATITPLLGFQKDSRNLNHKAVFL
jgi:hypothetical protein